MTSTGSSSRRRPAAEISGVPYRPAEVEATLAKLGVVPSKALGQSFLLDPYIADAEVALLSPGKDDVVIEIGGGLGLLTEALLRRGVEAVTVIERDPKLADLLRASFGERVTVIEGDALEVPWPTASAVVGNLPFSVATPILERVWFEKVPRFVGMVQREVAERLASGPGSKVYGRLSIVAALYGTIELFQPVPAQAFYPEPAVEGRILTFARRSGALPVPSVRKFETMLGSLFSARRKQLGNLLPRVATDRVDAADLAERAGWPLDWAIRRPESLPPEAFFSLARALEGRASRRRLGVPPGP